MPGRPLGKRLVDEADVDQVLVLAIAADAIDIGALRGVVEIGEAGVVELQIGAAERREAGDLLGVDLGEVVPERRHVGVGACGRSPRGRRGNAASTATGSSALRSTLASTLADRRFEEGEILAEDRLVEAELAADPMRGRAEFDRARLVLELDVQAMVAVADPADLVEKIHVPGAAAHFAVGDPPETEVALQLDRVADRLVLGARSSAAEIRPASRSARAFSNSAGRSRLPTWSARNGGVACGILGRPSLFDAFFGQRELSACRAVARLSRYFAAFAARSTGSASLSAARASS
jgi:hypothetical protein